MCLCMKRNERYLSFPTEIIDLVNERCSAKELYALILLRSKKYGYCYMTNQQFAKYFSTTTRTVTTRTVVNLLKRLKDSNVIRVEAIDKRHRRIYPLYVIQPQENFQEKKPSHKTNQWERTFPKNKSMGKNFPVIREKSYRSLEKKSSHYKAKSISVNNKLASLAVLAVEIEKKLGRNLTKKEQSWLNQSVNRDTEILKYAVDEAIKADAQSITGYAQAILNRFDAVGLVTIDDVMADRKKFVCNHNNRRANIQEQLPDWAEHGPNDDSQESRQRRAQLNAQLAGFELTNRLRKAVELARPLDDKDVEAIRGNLAQPNGYGNMTIDAPKLWERYCEQYNL